MPSLDNYNLSELASEIKTRYDRLKKLNRNVVKHEERLRMAIQDRILGAIDDDELERITNEAKQADNECFEEKCATRQLIKVLRDISDELGHVALNADYSGVELGTTINIAMMFSDVKKLKEKA